MVTLAKKGKQVTKGKIVVEKGEYSNPFDNDDSGSTVSKPALIVANRIVISD